MDQSLRQRGWSINSYGDDHSRRDRAESMATHQSEMTEQSMSEAEKLALLNSAFDHVSKEEEEHPLPASGARDDDKEEGEEDEMLFSSEKLNEDDYAAMFGQPDDDDSSSSSDGSDQSGDRDNDKPPRKRRRTGIETSVVAAGSNKDDTENGSSQVHTNNAGDEQKRPHAALTKRQQDQLNLAKGKLSKWAARLFDPNRPRGLVEAPQVIPLNDEFLTAFGKREKEYDEISGRVIDIDKTSLAVEASGGDDGSVKSSDRKGKKQNNVGCKIKIANLSYSTTTATIARTCGRYGPVVDVNIILDDNRQSTGRAYVLFENQEGAAECVNKMNEQTLEGRVIRVSIASSSSSGRKSMDHSSGLPGSSMKRKESRYWDRDISTKCHQCGEVGHIAANCPNEEKLRPCALCAQLGHDMWSCRMKCVCFNCGVPGHQSRDCPHRRGLPKRIICTICFQNGHHRFDCRERPWNVPSRDAICMQCGQKGHFMCSELRWFFGLKGSTCFNCGGAHPGERCRRANYETCVKNADVGRQEIEMAGSINIGEQLSNQRSTRESRGGDRNGSKRAKSLPPSQQRR